MRARLTKQDADLVSQKANDVLERLNHELTGVRAPSIDGEIEVDLHRLDASIQELSGLFRAITQLANGASETVDHSVLLTSLDDLIFADSSDTKGRAKQTRCGSVLLRALKSYVDISWNRNLAPNRGEQLIKLVDQVVLGQLITLTENDLRAVRGAGETTIERIKEVFESYGFKLGSKLTPEQVEFMQANGFGVVTRGPMVAPR